MKQKIFSLLSIIGASGAITMIILIACKIVSFDMIWVKYVLLICLTLIFLFLNLKFKKKSDLDETVSCARRTRRAIAAINTSKDINYVKKLSIQNQITNTILYVEDLITGRDLFLLKENLAAITAIRDRYKAHDDIKFHLDEEIVSKDLDIMDDLISKLKELL